LHGEGSGIDEMTNGMSNSKQDSSGSKVNPNCCLFIGDLSFYCTETELGELCSCYGNLVNVQIKRGRGGDSLMHGFAEYANESDAKNALEKLNNAKFMGRSIRYREIPCEHSYIFNLFQLIRITLE
jgi:RNA recognition motif-containing protein